MGKSRGHFRDRSLDKRPDRDASDLLPEVQILAFVEEVDLVQILQLHQLMAGQIVSANAVLTSSFSQVVVLDPVLWQQRVLDGDEANIDVLADVVGKHGCQIVISVRGSKGVKAHTLTKVPMQQFQDGRHASPGVVDVQCCAWATKHVARKDLIGAVGPVVEQELQRAVAENQEGLRRLHGSGTGDSVVKAWAAPDLHAH